PHAPRVATTLSLGNPAQAAKFLAPECVNSSYTAGTRWQAATVEPKTVRRHIGAMSEFSHAVSAAPAAAPPGDFVLPFDISKAGVRGRFVRLDHASAQALDAHQLPEAAARAAGESLALAALLGSALKRDGRLTVQTKSSGPLDLITADYYGAGEGKERGVR